MSSDGFSVAVAGQLLVLSGPCGTGKTSLAMALLDADPDLGYTRSVTTRPPRPGEEHYDYVDRATFQRMIDADEFVQWIHPGYDEFYGTRREPIEAALSDGRDLVFDYCPEGYLNLRRRYPDHTVGVFVMAPTVEEMERRLAARGTEDPAELKLRHQMALQDFNFVDQHDYHLVNSDLGTSLQTLQAIRVAERTRLARQPAVREVYRRHAVPTLVRYYQPV